MSLRPHRALFAALALLAAGACAKGGVKVEGRPPAPPRLVAVLPVHIEHPHDAYDRWLATRDVIRAVVGERRFDALAPEEISLLPDRFELPRLHEQTSVLVDAGREGYAAPEVVALRVVLRRETEDTERMVVGLAPKGSDSPDGRVLGRVRTMRAFAHVRLEVWHPASHVRLLRAARSFEEDLLAERAPGEPTPLGAAAAELVRAALRPLARRLSSKKRTPPLPFSGVENPYALGALLLAPASASAPVPVDPAEALAAEARLLERLREVDVRLGPAEARALAGLPTGLLVLADTGPLRAGDYVSGVSGVSGALGLAPVWRRWRRLARGESLVLTVRRGKETVEVTFPRP